MFIRIASNSDIDELVRIHKSTFDKIHFTMNFSNDLLSKYFSILIENMSYKLVAINEANTINGYLFADINPSSIVNGFRKNNLFGVLLVLLKNPRFIKEKLKEFLNINNNRRRKSDQLSIYLLASDPNLKGQGIASRLLEYFESEIINDGFKNYNLSVRLNNEPAIKFYLKHGFDEKSKNNQSIHFEKILQKN